MSLRPVLLALAAVAACKARTAPPMPDAGLPRQHEVGRCENLDLEGTCTLLPLRTDTASGTDVTYELSAHCVSGAHAMSVTVARVRVPSDRATDLERHYTTRGPVPCHCYLVRPPCNPDMTWIQVDLAAPGFAIVER